LNVIAWVEAPQNTSAEFVPFLERLATQLGSANLMYTKIHGEADVIHADQFAWAVGHEMGEHERAEESVEAAVRVTVEFLREIFA
jgi:hypothetical protein